MYPINTRNYLKCEDYNCINLEQLYNNNSYALECLDFDIEAIVETEAPLKFKIFKERLREVKKKKKISGKALEIIESHLAKFKYEITSNFYDKVIWPQEGIYKPTHLRIGYNRQIYDIPYQEMMVLSSYLIDNGYSGEILYRKILEYFGYEVLTEKALNYLKFVEEKTKEL